MDYRRLGRTDIDVSVASLGTGGSSLMGQHGEAGEQGVKELVLGAVDLGINFFDTSPEYDRSEALLGQFLPANPPHPISLATKFRPYAPDGTLAGGSELRASVERSLRRLAVDSIDVLQLHGVPPDLYEQVRDEHLPIMYDLQQHGTVRHLGITEKPRVDPGHVTLQKALHDDLFDTVMVAYNVLNTSALTTVLEPASRARVGVICMCAVRRSMSDPAYLEQQIREAKAAGHLDPEDLPDRDPLGWLLSEEVTSLQQAAYQFSATAPGVSTVLTGTGSFSHLRENIASMLGPGISEEARSQLHHLFGAIPVSLAE